MAHPGNGPQGPQSGSDDDITKIGALSDGFANTATNSTEVDDGAVGYVGAANGDNRNNDYDSTNTTTNTDASTDIDVDAKIDVAIGNGNDRDNDYDWSYNSKSDDDVTNTTTNTSTSSSSSDYDWSYDSKSFSYSDDDTKTVTDTDIKQTSDDDVITTTTNTSNENSHNYSESFYKSDTDFAVLDGVKDFDNLGIAGRDLTFNLGDDFSFTLDVDSILNNSLGGEGADTGFSVIQANHLADQDNAWNFSMNNEDANNNLKADGGTATGADGVDMDGKGWDLSAGDDLSGVSTANASAILANSGFHMELVQGANMLSNSVDSTITGGNSAVTDVGEDTGS